MHQVGMHRVGVFVYRSERGAPPNRKIVFKRQGDDASTLYAKVYAYVEGQGKELIAKIPGSKIKVISSCKSERLKIAEEAIENDTEWSFPPSYPITKHTSSQQDAILQHFKPKGPWRMIIHNDIGWGRFEKVTGFDIFNES